MIISEWAMLGFIVAFTVAILIFDLYLWFFTKNRMTISRAIVRTTRQEPWVGIMVVLFMCWLIYHLFGS